jgi:hypothetical protein
MGTPDQHWQVAVHEHLLSLAAKQQCSNATAAVGRHHDQITAQALSCIYNRAARLITLDRINRNV